MDDYNSRPIRPDLLYIAISSAVANPRQDIKSSELEEWADRCKQVRNIPQSYWPTGFGEDLARLEGDINRIYRAHEKLDRLMSPLVGVGEAALFLSYCEPDELPLCLRDRPFLDPSLATTDKPYIYQLIQVIPGLCSPEHQEANNS